MAVRPPSVRARDGGRRGLFGADVVEREFERAVKGDVDLRHGTDVLAGVFARPGEAELLFEKPRLGQQFEFPIGR